MTALIFLALVIWTPFYVETSVSWTEPAQVCIFEDCPEEIDESLTCSTASPLVKVVILDASCQIFVLCYDLTGESVDCAAVGYTVDSVFIDGLFLDDFERGGLDRWSVVVGEEVP